jgi:hypothetical protein
VINENGPRYREQSFGFYDASNLAGRNNHDRVGASLATFTLDTFGARRSGRAGVSGCTRGSCCAGRALRSGRTGGCGHACAQCKRRQRCDKQFRCVRCCDRPGCGLGVAPPPAAIATLARIKRSRVKEARALHSSVLRKFSCTRIADSNRNRARAPRPQAEGNHRGL